jgi:phosphoribosylanthranilate isomerase
MSGWIKICGIRDVATAEEAAKLGVSAIGLNFFEKSPRCVSLSEGVSISRHCQANVSVSSRLGLATSSPLPVALFVNPAQSLIEATTAAADITTIQLHGDERPEFLRELHERHREWSILKAFRVDDSLRPVEDFIAECRQLNVPLAGCLLDAHVEGSFGGTGQIAPWELIARAYDQANWPPLILAGGLTPDNVADAIQIVRPWGVDTSSGVESSPGVKDTTLLGRFVAEARRAFAAK